jgi:hypothetical protein
MSENVLLEYKKGTVRQSRVLFFDHFIDVMIAFGISGL